MSRICEICKGEQHTPEDHPYLPTMETHNPFDIPFGHEVKEKNMNVKDPGTEEGGTGSGRQPDYGDDITSSQAGDLVTFETVSIPGSASAVSIGGKKIEEALAKQLVDEKLKCRCKNMSKNT